MSELSNLNILHSQQVNNQSAPKVANVQHVQLRDHETEPAPAHNLYHITL